MIEGARIVWMTTSSRVGGSGRLGVYSVSDELARRGMASMVCQCNPPMSDTTLPIDIMADRNIFIAHNPVGDEGTKLVSALHSLGKKVIVILSDLYDFNDVILQDPYVMAGSEYYANLIRSVYEGIKISVIRDAWENPHDIVKMSYEQKFEKPTAVWFGCANDNYFFAREVVAPLLEKVGWKCRYITSHITADIMYTPDTVYEDMVHHDICFIPSMLGEAHKCKGHNRVVQAMALGMPTICSPVPDYMNIVKTYLNGYVAFSKEDWTQYSTFLLNPKERELVGKRGKASVLEAHSIKRQVDQWEDLIKEVLYAKENGSRFEERSSG